jgi:hypothetical protein
MQVYVLLSTTNWYRRNGNMGEPSSREGNGFPHKKMFVTSKREARVLLEKKDRDVILIVH